MATVIDSLVVQFDIDKKGYDKGQQELIDQIKKLREEAAEGSKKVTEANQKQAESFRGIKTEVLGLLAVFFGFSGFKAFIEGTMDTQAALGRLSKNLDVSTQRLDAWGTVAEEMGDKAGDSLGALQTIAAGIAEATIKGHSALTDAARANGVSLTDNQGKLLSSEGILLRFSARMQQLPRQQAIALANMAGIGGISNELLLGPEELQRRLTEAERLSRVTAESSAQAQELQRRWVLLQKRFKEVADLAWTRLEPILERLGRQLADWLDRVNWDRVIGQIGSFANQVDRVVRAFGGWEVVGLAVAAMLGLKLLSPLGAVLGLVTRLGPMTLAAAGGMASLGAAAGAALLALTGLAAFHIDALGGGQDDVKRPAGAKRPSNADLWNKVLGKPTAYAGSRAQAAQLLATRINPDQDDSPEGQLATRRTAAGVLMGQYRPGNGTIRADAEPGADSTPGADPSAGVSGPSDPLHSRIYGSNAELFSALEAKTGLPPGILARMYAKESTNGTNLTSKAGAQGPFQFLPGTAQEQGLEGDEVNDLDHSAAAAARYLARLRGQFGGDLGTALAAYNWGPGNVQAKGLANAPAETVDYMRLAQGLQIGPPQQFAQGTGGTAGPTSTTEVHIGTVNLQTQATDAKGIMRDLTQQTQRQSMVNGFNSGVE